MENQKITIKEKIKNGGFVLGTWCILPSPHVINVLAKAGLDFVLIDMEHGPADFVTAQNMLASAEAEGCEGIIRVSRNEEQEVLKALDIGASGVIIPHIENIKDRQKAVSYIKYPPLGVRGFSPYARAGSYSTRPGHTKIENKKTLSGIIIEGKKGINNLNKIIDDPNLDIIYIGVYDLSVVLGIPGDVGNPRIVRLLKDCVIKIRKKGKTAGALFHSEEELKLFKNIGIQFLCYKVDTSILYSAVKEVVELFKK